VLAARVLSEGLLVKILCSAYVISRSLYLFSLHFIKCADYVHYRVYCDSNFLANDFNHLTVEQKKLKLAWDAILKRLL
jgi:hypothetical protein